MLLGHVLGGDGSGDVITTVGAALEADGIGVTLIPGIVGRFFGVGWPSIVALTDALGGFCPLTIVRASGGRDTAYSLGRLSRLPGLSSSIS